MIKSGKTSINRSESDKHLLKMFGHNLKKWRESKHLSQEQLAHEVGFSRSYYTEVETGKRNISLLNIIKVAVILEIEVSELIQLKEFNNK